MLKNWPRKLLIILITLYFKISLSFSNSIEFNYDQDKLYIKIPKVDYRLFYSSKNKIEIFIPFIHLYQTEFNYSFYRIKSFNYSDLYSVITIDTNYLIPYELIEIDQLSDYIIFSFPFIYNLQNEIYFYTQDNQLISKFYYKLGLADLPGRKINYSSYRIELKNIDLFKINFIQYSEKKDIEFNSDVFWFAINGTYFAKDKNGKYFTVGGVVLDNQILSYPVEYRPNRGFLMILKDGSYLFGKLPSKKKEFEEFVKKYDIKFLVQAGPLIYQDFSYIMDPDSEGLGEKGNNIIPSAPRTFLFISNDNTLNFETVFGIGNDRKAGFNLYELAYYLSESKSAINLDGGSSCSMYVCNNKIQPIFEKDYHFKSQNYILFYTDKSFNYFSENTFYYYFPGLFGFSKINDEVISSEFGSKVITYFDGYSKKQKVVFNENLEVLHKENKIFLQTNDIELALEKIKSSIQLKKINQIIKYYNCYIIVYE